MKLPAVKMKMSWHVHVAASDNVVDGAYYGIP